MNGKLVFCEECRDDVECTVTEVSLTGKIKGTEYCYVGKEARCAKCGAQVYVPEINDSNLKALYDVYRQENGIVSLETILAIPQKYGIGKRPLSLLLGWGEQTFSRYCDGDVPTKQYSAILARIYEDPAYYTELLERGKGKLKPSGWYEKSRKAVDALIHAQNGEASRIDVVIEYFLSKCGDVTHLALQKALYYTQGFYYAFFGSFLFNEDCEAWVHGPVYPGVYQRYCNYKFGPISEQNAFDESCLTALEKAVLDSVANSFCCYSGKVLERFTHSESPWLDARGDLPCSAPSNRVVPKESIGDYFSAVKTKYNMVKPSDIRSYAADMFGSMYTL